MNNEAIAFKMTELDDDGLARWLFRALYEGVVPGGSLRALSSVSSHLYDIFQDLPTTHQFRVHEALATVAASLEPRPSKIALIRETAALVAYTRDTLAAPALVQLVGESSAYLMGEADTSTLVLAMEQVAAVLSGLAADPRVFDFCVSQLRWPGTDLRLLPHLAAGIATARPSEFANVFHELVQRLDGSQRGRLVSMLNELPSHMGLERLADQLVELQTRSVLRAFVECLQDKDCVLHIILDDAYRVALWDSIEEKYAPITSREICDSPEALDLLLRDQVAGAL